MTWIAENKEWLFSGLGITMLISFLKWFGKRRSTPANSSNSVIVNNSVIHNGSAVSAAPLPETLQTAKKMDKQDTRILFVDDDTRFKVVRILKNAGWPHVKIVKDISSLDAPELVEASILFLDIQGVGKALHFSDEGLGLALAIRSKYPEKKLVIYSSQPTGDRFHAALRASDGTLAKNADPYQFMNLVETLSSK